MVSDRTDVGEAVEQGGGHRCMAEASGQFAEALASADDKAGTVMKSALKLEELRPPEVLKGR